jgi:hypothetical protein
MTRSCSPRIALNRRGISRLPRSAHSGVAAVEFVLVLPFLLLVLAITIDFGRLGFDRSIVGNAARLAAAVASHQPPGDSDHAAWKTKVREQVERELSQLGGFDPEDVELDVQLIDDGGLASARVELAYPFRMLFDWPSLGSEMLIRQIVVTPLETN